MVSSRDLKNLEIGGIYLDDGHLDLCHLSLDSLDL